MDAETHVLSREALAQLAAVAGIDISEERREAVLADVRTMLAHGRNLDEISVEEVIPATLFRPEGEV